MRGLPAFLLACTGCAGFLHDQIPATATPVREARYGQSQDAANAIAGFAADQALRLVFHGPTDHTTQISDSNGVHRGFRWTSGAASPLLRVGSVAVLGGIRRGMDPNYREGGWLVNIASVVVNEWLHYLVGAIRGHL